MTGNKEAYFYLASSLETAKANLVESNGVTRFNPAGEEAIKNGYK